MNINDLWAIILLFCAVTDTLFAQLFLPGMLRKNPQIGPEQAKKIIKFVNQATLAFVAAAIMLYVIRPL